MPSPRGSRVHAVWLLALLAVAVVASAAYAAELTFPKLSGRVVDAADILSPDTEASLTRALAAFEQQSGGTQIVVATVPSLQGQAIESYGYQLGRAWGIGQRGKNTGALLIVAPKERQVRIEVGYGLEGTLTDALSSDIIQGRILPRFRQGDFDGGVRAGVEGMIAVLGGTYQPTVKPEQRGDRQQRRHGAGLLFWIIVGFILLSSFGRRRRGGLGRALLLGSVLGGIGRGGRGGFGGGGLGGGGFSGGGGSFGGGGASGSW